MVPREDAALVFTDRHCAIGAGFYFRDEIKDQIRGAKIPAYASNAIPPFRNTSDSQPIRAASPKSPTVSSTKGKFRFFPYQKNRLAWSIKYPDGPHSSSRTYVVVDFLNAQRAEGRPAIELRPEGSIPSRTMPDRLPRQALFESSSERSPANFAASGL